MERTELDLDIDAAVDLALEEARADHEASGSVRKLEPRILARDGGTLVCRRPFRRRGAWCVKLAGTARLSGVWRENGVIVFGLDWS